MKETIIFATNNAHKVKEVNAIAGSNFHFVSLKEMGIHVDIPETGASFEENAYQKADFIFEKYKYACIAEDSGLVIETLNGAPGIYSSRYAGEACNHDRNMDLVLKQLENKSDRSAHFHSSLVFVSEKHRVAFDGQCPGQIATTKMGSDGFGYDPIFIPTGYTKSFAALTNDIKNKLSHRKIALVQFIAYLNKSI